jgi:hypothetical protein
MTERRGMSLIVVLVVLSVSMALACAVLRTQGATVQLARNTDRQDTARRAALSGLTAAIRRMHVQGDWAGVGSTWSGSLSATQSFSVSYTAGDASLTAGQADYGEYPFRVTLMATGYAQDPAYSAAVATYTIRAVVRLVPKKLADPPTGWATLAPYTVYQWLPSGSTLGSAFEVEVPCQFRGGVRIRSDLTLCDDYPEDTDARDRLLKDLNAMRAANLGDHRPFTGGIYLPSGSSTTVRNLLTQKLGLTVTDTASTDTVSWLHPGTVSTYQLYAGGPVYTVPTISTTLQNTMLQPDQVTNPLGLFYCADRLYLNSNVTVRGTLITNTSEGDIFINGTNVQVQPVNLPPLDGTTTPVQLPVMVLRDDLRVFSGSHGSVQGLVAVWDEVEFQQGPQTSTSFTVEGRLLGKQFFMRGRDEWDQSLLWWQFAHGGFEWSADHGGTPYFPVWLQSAFGLAYTPRIRVQPPASPPTYHWNGLSNPIYVPGPGDPGLRWEVVTWKETP